MSERFSVQNCCVSCIDAQSAEPRSEHAGTDTGSCLSGPSWPRRRARDEGVGLPPLPAVLQAHGDLPGRRRRRGAAATGRSCSSAARPPTRCSGRSSRPPQEAGYPLTDDVNGYRQEGFARFDRNVHRGRRLSAARAYLHPVRDRKNLTVETLRVRHQGAVPGQAGGRGRLPARRPAAPQRRCRPRWSCVAARSTPRSCSSSPASATRRCSGRTASTSCTTCPASGRTSRTTSRSTSSTPRKQPVSIAPGLRMRARPRIGWF